MLGCCTQINDKAGWAIFDPEIFRSFLADSIEPSVAEDLLWTAYALSKSRHGTVVQIYSKGIRQLASQKMGSESENDPVGRLLVDGVKGRTITELKQGRNNPQDTLLRRPDCFQSAWQTGRYRFHNRYISCQKGCYRRWQDYDCQCGVIFGKAIKVSQDGPIELYQEGRLIYRFG